MLNERSSERKYCCRVLRLLDVPDASRETGKKSARMSRKTFMPLSLVNRQVVVFD